MNDQSGLTHVDEHGKASLVNVTEKPITRRRAVARCLIHTAADVVGDLWLHGCAQVAAVQAAKATSSIIPLCHPLPVDTTEITTYSGPGLIEMIAITEVFARTGIEMEGLFACAVARLSVMSSLLVVDPMERIDELALRHKSGGRSGVYERPRASPPVVDGDRR